MEDEETKLCSNCKREIPSVNFTIHSVHCARNIKICPVCKEPVPSADLKAHHELLHKLLPCKQCGESVCGTDLEDHIRDSCANTVKTCRYCELELPRRELPSHEAYCGVRTEQCADCQEYVMIKYRQLHLDSNHGFIRLDDDPAPAPAPAPPKRDPKPLRANNVPTPTASTSNGRSIFDETPRNFVPKTEINYFNNIDAASSSSQQPSSSRPHSNGTKKRDNNQPQINTYTSHTKDLNKDLSVSRGAVKKRLAPAPPAPAPPAPAPPAPAPPAPAPPADPKRDLPYYSAVQRRQREERDRHEQNLYNAAHGLPPVLSPAAKLEKLRKLDALQNPEAAEVYRRANRRKIDNNKQMNDGARRRIKMDLQNAKPMSPEEFMARFSQLQVAPAPVAPAPVAPAPADRFRDIKTSLTELRRGLNEVTAPYNMNNNNERCEDVIDRSRPTRQVVEERLPCEFCEMMLLPQDLVQHQTGCRPDLAQYVPPRAPSPLEPYPRPRSPSPCDPPAPVIPCEFCARSLPVYLINEHQEQCAREVDLIGD